MMVALIAFGAYLAKRARLIGSMWAKAMLFRKWKATGQKSPILCPAAWRGGGDEKAERAADGKDGADDEFGDFVRFAPALAIPTVEDARRARGS